MAADLTKQQLMFSLIEVWKQTEKSQQEFCKEKDLDYHQFQYWLRRYKHVGESMKSPLQANQPGFTQVKFKQQTTSSAAMELVLPDGRRLVFHQPVDVTFLRSLLN